jgi:hypothetical protein
MNAAFWFLPKFFTSTGRWRWPRSRRRSSGGSRSAPVLAGGVVRAGNAGDVEHLLALGEFVERDRDRRGGRTEHQRDLVVVDEGLLALHRLVRLGAAVGDDELDLLAKEALGDLGGDLLDQRMAGVDVLDGKLHALELVLSRFSVGAGAWHRGADGHRGAGAAVRKRADRRLISGERTVDECEPANAAGGQGAEPRSGCDRLPQETPPRERRPGLFVSGHVGLLFCVDFCLGSNSRLPVFTVFSRGSFNRRY